MKVTYSWLFIISELRAVFEYDDGTRSQTAFKDPLGKFCERDYHDFPQVEFMKISGPICNIGQN